MPGAVTVPRAGMLATVRNLSGDERLIVFTEYKTTLDYLARRLRERTRIVEHLLPARFAMAGNAQAFPVAVEIRLPEC